jgi:dynein heavy chain
VIAASTEIEIDTARQAYIPVAKHSAVLFFCITELANIDPMYQYSLTWFLHLFVQSIIKSPKSEQLDERLSQLNDFFTRSIYDNVCRSLFEKDKLVFSFSLSVGILTARGVIDRNLFNFFLVGATVMENLHPNPAPEWLTEKSWHDIVRAGSSLEQLRNLHENVKLRVKEWKEFYDKSSPENESFPEPYQEADDLVYLILLKCIRPDKIIHAVKKFIVRHMGREFVEPPAFDMQASYNESSPTTPLIFILSPGSDPMDNLMMFAKEHSMHEK